MDLRIAPIVLLLFTAPLGAQVFAGQAGHLATVRLRRREHFRARGPAEPAIEAAGGEDAVVHGGDRTVLEVAGGVELGGLVEVVAHGATRGVQHLRHGAGAGPPGAGHDDELSC